MHITRCFGDGANAGSEVKAETVGAVWEQFKAKVQRSLVMKM